MVRQFSVIWCGKSVKFDRVGRAFVELNIGSTHGVPSESDVATVSLPSSTYAIEYGDLYGGWVRVHHHTNVCKIERLCGAMPSLSLDVSPLNLVSHLILMPSLPAASMDIRLLLLNKSPLKKKKQNRGRVYSRYVVVTNYNSVLLDSLTKWRAAGKIELSKRLVPFSYKEI